MIRMRKTGPEPADAIGHPRPRGLARSHELFDFVLFLFSFSQISHFFFFFFYARQVYAGARSF